MALPDLRSSSIEVKPGYYSTVLITSSVHVTDENTDGLAEQKRHCRFNFEAQNMKLTKIYSQSGCIFECQLEEALEFCGCTPWNYPHLKEEGFSRVCDFWGKKCFDNVMANFTLAATKCTEDICPPECVYHRYLGAFEILLNLDHYEIILGIHILWIQHCWTQREYAKKVKTMPKTLQSTGDKNLAMEIGPCQ